jgi:hypothetical protein
MTFDSESRKGLLENFRDGWKNAGWVCNSVRGDRWEVVLRTCCRSCPIIILELMSLM